MGGAASAGHHRIGRLAGFPPARRFPSPTNSGRAAAVNRSSMGLLITAQIAQPQSGRTALLSRPGRLRRAVLRQTVALFAQLPVIALALMAVTLAGCNSGASGQPNSDEKLVVGFIYIGPRDDY